MGACAMNSAIAARFWGGDWFYVMLLLLVMLALGIYMVISVGAVLVRGWMDYDCGGCGRNYRRYCVYEEY